MSGIRGTLIVDAGTEFAAVRDYYHQFPREPTNLANLHIEVVATASVKDLTFVKVLAQMIASSEKSFVLVAHGSEYGFFMPIYGKDSNPTMFLDTGVGIAGMVATLNKLIDPVSKALAIDDEVKKAKSAKKPLSDADITKKWQDFFNGVSSMTDPPPPAQADIKAIGQSTPPKKPDPNADGLALLDKWLKSTRGILGVSQAELFDLVKKVLEVRKKNIERVEVRGCHIGVKPEGMKVLRTTLGCRILTAPCVSQFYVPVSPSYGPNNYATFRGTALTGFRRTFFGSESEGTTDLWWRSDFDVGHDPVIPQVYAREQTQLASVPMSARGHFALEIIRKSATEFSSLASAKDLDFLNFWVARYIMPGSRYNATRRRDFVTAGMFCVRRPDLDIDEGVAAKEARFAFALPREKSYRKMLAVVQ